MRWLSGKARRAWIAARRARFVPVAVRAGIVGAGVAVALLADPRIPAFAVLALAPALLPATVVPGGFLVLAVLLWVLDTTTTHSGSIGLVRLIALAVAMYYVHAGAALAAVLPYDTVVAARTIVRWLGRFAVVTALTVAIGIMVGALEGEVAHGSALLATVGGLVVVIATTIFIGRIGLARGSRRG